VKTHDLKINAERLTSRLDALAQVGATPEGGVRRFAAGDQDKHARDLFAGWLEAAGLEVKIDRIGNIFGLRAGTSAAPTIMSGSHLDSVDNGGRLDGALGVLAALEAVECLNDADLTTKAPICVAAFTNEEGVRFQPDMMGSLVYAGGLALETALSTRDRDGVTLGAELSRIGYAGDMTPGAMVPQTFIELHIEQGPVLDVEKLALGAVEALQGISWTEIVIDGEANHAGTTPMGMRRDAGYCAGAVTEFVRRLALDLGGAQVATVGTIELTPNVINVVPGRARLTVDLRNRDNEALYEAERRLEDFCGELEAEQQVQIALTRLARFDPVIFDPGIVTLVEAAAGRLGVSCRRMTSGAGHDAQMMARICPTAMIFVPSVRGISHNPAEHTNRQDLITGATVLLQTLMDLAG